MAIFSSNNTFRGEGPGEKTLLLTRKHRLNLWGPLYVIIGSSLIPLVLYLLVKSADWYPLIAPLYTFLVSVFFLFLWNMAFYFLTIYFLNALVVTNKRVIEYEQNGFFNYTSNELEIEKIQDISVRRRGSLSYFLDFGEIEIQSGGAGAEKEILVTLVPKPDEIKEVIMQESMKK